MTAEYLKFLKTFTMTVPKSHCRRFKIDAFYSLTLNMTQQLLDCIVVMVLLVWLSEQPMMNIWLSNPILRIILSKCTHKDKSLSLI